MRVSKALLRKLQNDKHVTWRRKHAKKQGHLCAYCGHLLSEDPRSRWVTTLDHVVPIARGGRDHWENTCAACRVCNQSKADRTAEEFLKEREQESLSL